MALGPVAFFSLAALTLIFSGQAKAQQILTYWPGAQCPNVTTMAKLDVSRYLGLWYEYARLTPIFEINSRCVTATYAKMPDGNTNLISVTNRATQNLLVDFPTKAQGRASVPDPSNNPASLMVSFDMNKGATRPAADTVPNYLVLDTDYDNYAVVFGCKPMGSLVRNEYGWILTRTPKPQDTTAEYALSVLEKQTNIHRSMLTFPYQGAKCTYEIDNA